MVRLIYKANPKHKRGSVGEGPPRWFPDSDALCPDDMDQESCQALLESSVEAADLAHPNARARFAMHRGEFFKGYPEEGDGQVEVWHGYPVETSRVPLQVPTRVLRKFREMGLLPSPEYRKLLGRAK